MQALWRANGWVKLQDIRELLDYHRPVAYTTVATVTGNLWSKGLVHRDLRDRASQPGAPVWWYRAAQPETEHIGELIATLLDHSPSPAATLAHAMATVRRATKIKTQLAAQTAAADPPATAPTVASPGQEPPASPAGGRESPAATAGASGPRQAAEGDIRPYIEAADEAARGREHVPPGRRAGAGDPAGAARRLARASHAGGGNWSGWDRAAVGGWRPDADQRYLIALQRELAALGARCELEDRGPWPRLRVYCPDESATAEFDNNVIAALVNGQWCYCWPSAVPIGPVGSLTRAATEIMDELGLGGDPGQAVASLPVWRMLHQARQTISRPRVPDPVPSPHIGSDRP